jgi:hypothetical protein
LSRSILFVTWFVVALIRPTLSLLTCSRVGVGIIVIFVIIVIAVAQILVVIIHVWHIEERQVRLLLRCEIILNVTIVKYNDAAPSWPVCSPDLASIDTSGTPWLIGAGSFNRRLERKSAKDIAQVPRPVGIYYPDLDAAIWRAVLLCLQTQKRTKIDHATNTQADDHAATATLRLHHGRDEIMAGFLQITVTRDRVNLVRNIVML